MLTVFNGNKEFSRNVSLFKRAPTDMENISGEIPEPVCSNNFEANLNGELANNNNDLDLETEQVTLPGLEIIREQRVSTRVKKPINRYIAEPASGLINREPKKL